VSTILTWRRDIWLARKLVKQGCLTDNRPMLTIPFRNRYATSRYKRSDSRNPAAVHHALGSIRLTPTAVPAQASLALTGPLILRLQLLLPLRLSLQSISFFSLAVRMNLAAARPGGTLSPAISYP
jgi:hypothetical protein